MKNDFIGKIKNHDEITNILHWLTSRPNRFLNSQAKSSICSKSEDHDIINSNIINNEDASMIGDSKQNLEFRVNWGSYTDDLASIAMPENWSNSTYPYNGILKNYLIHTYKKLKLDNAVVSTPDYAIFNTGLFTKYYEPIYAFTTDEVNVIFLTEYYLASKGITSYPLRANYFSKPEELIFDYHYKINVQYRHILEDEGNRDRFPSGILNSGNIVTILDGAIDTMKKRVSANYKLAIPQYYDGKIQLLLPLCLLQDNIPDLALVVTKAGSCYQGHTCLTLDMAYNNARLIAKPEGSWLS